MGKSFTIADILKGPCGKLNQHLVINRQTRKRSESKEKIWMQYRLEEYAKENNLELSTEHLFAKPERKWRFDFSFNEILTAFEYEGIIAGKSRHTTITGYTGDADKYNRAQQLGWKVYRYTALNYLNLLIDLQNIKYGTTSK